MATDQGQKYAKVERRKVIIEMSFKAAGNTGQRDRTRDERDDTVRRMKREGMFV